MIMYLRLFDKNKMKEINLKLSKEKLLDVPVTYLAIDNCKKNQKNQLTEIFMQYPVDKEDDQNFGSIAL